MPFRISEALLLELRAHRERRRLVRAEHRAATAQRVDRAANFIATIRRLFAGATTVKAAANAYVSAMNEWEDELERTHDAFLLYPGMGPMLYLTADGRVLEDSRGWDGDAVVELTGDQANAALVVGAKKTGISALLDLLPPRPPDGKVCPKCSGTRVAEPIEGFGSEFPCDMCGSRGWLAAD